MLSALRMQKKDYFNSNFRDREWKVKFYPAEKKNGENKGKSMLQVHEIDTKGTMWAESLW